MIKISKDLYEKHHLVHFAEGPISVYESGNESFPAVLLLHGAMYDESRLIWHNLVPVLSEKMHVLAIDFPRHGLSRPWKGNVSKEVLNRIVDQIVESFKLKPVLLIGLSMGGGVSIEYMLEYQNKVKGAILMAPGGLGDRIKNQFLSWLFVKTPGILPFFTRYYGKLTDEKYRDVAKKLLHEGEKTKDFEIIVQLIKEEAKRKAEGKEMSMDDWQLNYLAPFKLKLNYLNELHRIKVPILWLENDPLVGRLYQTSSRKVAE